MSFVKSGLPVPEIVETSVFHLLLELTNELIDDKEVVPDDIDVIIGVYVSIDGRIMRVLSIELTVGSDINEVEYVRGVVVGTGSNFESLDSELILTNVLDAYSVCGSIITRFVGSVGVCLVELVSELITLSRV